MDQLPSLEGVHEAAALLDGIALKSPFEKNYRISTKLQAEVFIKREDLQLVRSFKIRGAFNKINSLSEEQRKLGIVCASAGNHAQGFAFACKKLKIHGKIFMPSPTPKQKVAQVKMFGEAFVEIILTGDTYDDSQYAAINYSSETNKIFIHPFDDKKVIEGQATIALEMIQQSTKPLDYVFVPIGGGGLISGIITVFKSLSPKTIIIGVEPSGARSMQAALENGERIVLDQIDRFVDGAAVKCVGALPFLISQQHLNKTIGVHEGKICQTILELYNKEGIVAEPAGALSLAALDSCNIDLKGKRVAAILCGGNNDIMRTPEIKERALFYAQLKHYFAIRFPQRAGALKEFVTNILGPDDDITFFEFSKKSNRDKAPAIVGIELKQANDLKPLVQRMKDHNFYGVYLNEKPDLLQFLI